jgi:virulence factor Mce-like protein
MMGRTSRNSVLGNPVLVGAVTVLVVVVAVFLSYNANKGLPFVPTTQLEVELPNGANLLPGNEVREGGHRIGVVDSMRAVALPEGKTGALAVLKLDKEAGDVPVDSRVSIRPRSVLGLKYVELDRGKSERALRQGDTLPVDRAHVPVELDEFYGIFDERTREGTRQSLHGFGDAFTARGASLNRTIEDAPRFLEHLEPVMATLAAPGTELDEFFAELGDFTRIVAPVADRYAHSFSAGADVFRAWSRHPGELRRTIEKSVPTLDTSIESLRAQRPFLSEFAKFSAELDDAARELPRTLPRFVPALDAGIPVLKRSPRINEELGKTFVALEDLAEAPGTGRALRGLISTVGTLNPALRFLGPYVTVCNYFNYSWTHVAEHLTEPDITGGSQRTLLNQAGRQDNSVSSLGATEPANGKGVINGTPQHLHLNTYTAAVTDDGRADCESGQRGYLERVNTYGDPSLKTVVDPHTPGVQGPTFTGRPRVPAGQTWSRHPEIGPQMPQELR